MGRKRNTFVKVTISSPEKFVEVKDPTLQFEKEAEELISKMEGLVERYAIGG